MKKFLLLCALNCILFLSCKKQSATEEQYSDVFPNQLGTSGLKLSTIKAMLVGNWELDFAHGGTTYYDKDKNVLSVFTYPNSSNNYYQFTSFPTYIDCIWSNIRVFDRNNSNKLEQLHLKVIDGVTYLYINVGNALPPSDYKQFWKFESVSSNRIVASLSDDMPQLIDIGGGKLVTAASSYTKVTWIKYTP